MRTVSAQQFVEFLEEQSSETLKGGSVSRFLQTNRFAEDAFDEFIFFCDAHYARNLVSKNPNYELMLLCWLPMQGTPIHNHGGQRCWMRMLNGQIETKNYQILPGGKLSTPENISLSQGESSYIDDSHGVHCLSNRSQKPAVSVHLYAGPVKECLIYDPNGKTSRRVSLEYFSQYGELSLPTESHPNL